MKELRWVTGGCCQWHDSASYDSGEVIETFVLRRNYSGKIATEQQPPNRYHILKKKDSANKQEHTILFDSGRTFHLAEICFYTC